MSRLETVVLELKSHIGEGIEPALKYLEQVLSPASPRFNDFIQIKGRYNSLQRELLLGTIDQATYDKGRNAISNALLLLADDLTENDLKPASQIEDPTADKRGDILYHIPDQMQLNREEKCVVRVAWVLDALLREWEKTEVDVVREIRMADIMGVELLNLDERNPFTIRTLSETVQFVDRDDFTEWVFYVRPLLAGEFALILRVSVIELINNKEYKKGIVLEEKVKVVAADIPPADPAQMKPAHEALVLGGNDSGSSRGVEPPAGAGPQAPATAPATPSLPPAPQATGASTKSVVRLFAVVLVAATTLVLAAIGIPYYQESQLWAETMRCGKPYCAKRYLDKYPDGRHSAEATAILTDSLSANPDTTSSLPAGPAPAQENPGNQTLPDTVQRSADLSSATPVALPEKQKKAKPGPKKSLPARTRPSTPAKPEPLGPPLPPNWSGPAKNNADAGANEPDLRGKVFYFKVPEFEIAAKSGSKLNFKYLKFNEFHENLIILSNKKGIRFQPGQTVELVAENGQSFPAAVLYASRLEGTNLSKGYFRLNAAALSACASGSVVQLRISDTKSKKTTDYHLDAAQRQALKQYSEMAQNQIQERTRKD